MALIGLACSRSRSAWVGEAAPNFHAQVASRRGSMSLADLRGKVVVLSVIASGCAQCRLQLSTLQALHDSIGNMAKVIVVDEDSLATVSRADVGIDGAGIEIVHDLGGTVARTYGVEAYPELFIIDARGVIRGRWIGTNHWSAADLSATVRMLQ